MLILFPQGICTLDSSMTSRGFRGFCVYFPTAWDADGAVKQMYDVLNLLVDACVEARDIPIVGGDFNGCIGLLESDDLTMLQHVGPVGMGQRNARGTMVMKLRHYIFNTNGSRQGHESCTCRRVSAGNFVQIDFVIGDAYFSLKKPWHNCCNDHRCVHCKFSRMQAYKQQYRRKHVLKRWKPIMDENGEPSAFQTLLETKIGEQNAPTFDAAENFLMSTAVATGTCACHKFTFTPSDRLRHLRQRRQQAHHNATRKFLTFQIQGWQPYSKKIWHTRHAGRIYKRCLHTVTSHRMNTLHWMSLL